MDMTTLTEQLAERAWLHDDPRAYLAGVRDALGVVTEELEVTREAEDVREVRGA